jgi:hypothetical protein
VAEPGHPDRHSIPVTLWTVARTVGIASSLALVYHESMGRTTITLLLILNMLACPFRCMTGQCCVLPDESCPPATCHCCSASCGIVTERIDVTARESGAGTSQPRSTHSSPGDSRTPSPCDCKNCLCDGAILEDYARASGDATHTMSKTPWMWWDAIAESYRPVGGADRVDRPPPNFFDFVVTGRDRLIAFQFWRL